MVELGGLEDVFYKQVHNCWKPKLGYFSLCALWCLQRLFGTPIFLLAPLGVRLFQEANRFAVSTGWRETGSISIRQRATWSLHEEQVWVTDWTTSCPQTGMHPLDCFKKFAVFLVLFNTRKHPRHISAVAEIALCPLSRWRSIAVKRLAVIFLSWLLETQVGGSPP